MELHGGVEGGVKHQLLIRVALHPVLLSTRALALLQGSGLVLAQECSDGEVGIGIQQLQATNIDGVRYVCVTPGQVGASPCDAAGASTATGAATATTTARTACAGVLDIAAELLNSGLQGLRVATLDLLDNIAITEDDEGG